MFRYLLKNYTLILFDVTKYDIFAYSEILLLQDLMLIFNTRY